MSTLRLIILVSGIIFIAVIYFWETLKQRKIHRKQTVRQAVPEHDLPGSRISPSTEPDKDYSGILSELNQTLVDSKRKEEITGMEPGLLPAKQEAELSSRQEKYRTELPETRDLFGDLNNTEAGTNNNVNHDIDENHIISLHVTAMPADTFHGNEILDAVDKVGMEYGDMKIFHHYGVGEMKSNNPLFSLADMYEPGIFDPEHIDNHRTRGLTLFFCLPVRIDAELVFELMLNTAQRLAEILKGEVRGGDHNLINDDRITDIRNKLKLHAPASS